MPRSNAALPLVAILVLGLGSTACEKQSPWVTVTADGVVVKMRATKYCREAGKCNESTDNPVLKVGPGDTVGVDVPRSVAEQGWHIPVLAPQRGPQEPVRYRHDHYFSFRIPEQVQSGQQQEFVVERDPKHGEATWRFTVRVK